MAPLRSLWNAFTGFLYTMTLSPFADYDRQQQPIGSRPYIEETDQSVIRPPYFRPPGSNIDGFHCDYRTTMPDWNSCQTATDKSCWLRNTKTGKELTVYSDYETANITGIVRPYTLYVEDGWWNADGINFTEAKLINGTFPGPLIEACWGDILEVTVINTMKFNGTSIHWHGLRQLHNMPMDGVNGVTQCPIAPGDQFTYRIPLTQYGSSWLHSHFSVQYADGVQAPLTIHGPTSDNFDYAVRPLMMSDWGHNSAFESQFHGDGAVLNRSVILDGIGNINTFTGTTSSNTTVIPPPYEMLFDLPVNPITGGARYLVRIINSAYESGMVFSIDNHTLQVVEVDFVPIVSNTTYNHTTPSILVAIGQRYHVIVEALPQCLPKNGVTPQGCNFWVRTLIATGCKGAPPPTNKHYMQTGILRYNASDKSEPGMWQWPNLPLNCTENYDKFLPTVPWQVPSPVNDQDSPNGEEFDIHFTKPGPYALASFSFFDEQRGVGTSFQTTYGNPTLLNLANLGGAWPVNWMVVPENYTSKDYIYLVLTDNGHPIHLHGHDFAILKREDTHPYDPTQPLSCTATNPQYKLNCNNPTRRDVVVLAQQYTVIAFKTDNPGTWLMHCHIAFHASAGLALQIMERQGDAYGLWPAVGNGAVDAARDTCARWSDWAYDCQNYWPGNVGTLGRPVYPSCDNATLLQNDSGI